MSVMGPLDADRSRPRHSAIWIVSAVLILLVATAAGLVGVSIEGDVHREVDQDLALAIQHGTLKLVTGLFLLVGAAAAGLAVVRRVRGGLLTGRWIGLAGAAGVGALLGIVVGGLVFATPAPRRSGVARAEVAGVTIGRPENEVWCHGRGPDDQPAIVASAGTRGGIYTGSGFDDGWFVRGDREGPEVRMRLELPADGQPPARAEVAIGSSLYRSDPSTVATMQAARWPFPEDGSVINDWPSGTATLEELSLSSGPFWDGRATVSLQITWACDRP